MEQFYALPHGPPLMPCAGRFRPNPPASRAFVATRILESARNGERSFDGEEGRAPSGHRSVWQHGAIQTSGDVNVAVRAAS